MSLPVAKPVSFSLRFVPRALAGKRPMGPAAPFGLAPPSVARAASVSVCPPAADVDVAAAAAATACVGVAAALGGAPACGDDLFEPVVKPAAATAEPLLPCDENDEPSYKRARAVASFAPVGTDSSESASGACGSAPSPPSFEELFVVAAALPPPHSPSSSVCSGIRPQVSVAVKAADCSSSSPSPPSVPPAKVHCLPRAAAASTAPSAPAPIIAATAAADGDDGDMFCDDADDRLLLPVRVRVPAPAAAAGAAPLPPSLPRSASSDGPLCVDPEGYYLERLGELLCAGRYRVLGALGKGVYSTVLRCADTQSPSGLHVAVKVVRANESMAAAARAEATVLARLGAADAADVRHCVRLLCTASHRGHTCLVFEACGTDLRCSVGERVGKGVGLPPDSVRVLCRQMFTALRHVHACGYVHADVKPDNLLVSGEKNNVLKLCDFGTALPIAELPTSTPSPLLQSRFYRCPEVLLGLPRSAAMDMWSAGCVLFELFTGSFAFTGSDNLELLRSMTRTLGAVPARLLRAASLRDQYYFADRDVLLPPAVDTPSATSSSSSSSARDGAAGGAGDGAHNVAARVLAAAVRAQVRQCKQRHPNNAALLAAARELSPAAAAEARLFGDLIDKLLTYDAAKRLTAEQVLRHELFRAVGLQ